MLGTIRWELLAVLAATWLAATLCGMTAAGHFPREQRRATMKTSSGFLMLWGSLVCAGVSALVAAFLAFHRFPWTAVVIAGGLSLLIAPLCLQALPDKFVDGRRGLVSFAAAAGVLAIAGFVI